MLKLSGKYQVREYSEDDEDEVVRLFNKVYRGYAGFVPRTPEYWRWSSLDRPDVDREGIIIVVDKEKIVGYGVVGKSGNIWELCYNHAYNGKYVVSLILETTIDYLDKAGSDFVTLNVPSEDPITRKTCKDLGFVETPPERMFLGLLDFQRFLELLTYDKKEKLASFNESILIMLKDAPFWIDANIIMEKRNGAIQIKGGTGPHQVLIKTKVVTLMSILFGNTKPLKALLSLRLKIHPFWKIPSTLRLLSCLRIGDPWFFPRTDFG